MQHEFVCYYFLCHAGNNFVFLKRFRLRSNALSNSVNFGSPLLVDQPNVSRNRASVLVLSWTIGRRYWTTGQGSTNSILVRPIIHDSVASFSTFQVFRPCRSLITISLLCNDSCDPKKANRLQWQLQSSWKSLQWVRSSRRLSIFRYCNVQQ
jgi:hypothetical protein